MEFYTLDRNFIKQETISEFESGIWTERYYGDDDFEILVTPSPEMISMLPKGQFIMCEDSNIPMILETREIKKEFLKVTGISLTQWLNNRFFRATYQHDKREFVYSGQKAGQLISLLVKDFCIDIANFTEIGIPDSDLPRFKIPGLVIGNIDLAGDPVSVSVPYAQLYDVIRPIAVIYEIGMKIKLDYATVEGYQISFHTYRGADRTSAQNTYPVIQFSEEMDSFNNITDFESIADHRNLVYMFAPNNPVLPEGQSYSSVPDTTSGFDLKIHQGFDDVSDLASNEMFPYLTEKAKQTVANLKQVQLVDGEIVQNKQVKYEESFFLGDIVEVVGNTGITQTARITEYIRSQDSSGERAYPALSMID